MNEETRFIFESAIARLDLTIKRLWILCIILITLLFGTNLAWVIYESQYVDEVSVEQEVDTGEGDAYVNGIGDFYYGEDKAESD